MTFVEDRSVLSRVAPQADEVVNYGPLDDHLADIRYAKESPANRPLVVFIHGGYWRPQIDRTHTGPLGAALAAAGWTVACIEYRRVPGEPDLSVEDVSLALQKIPGTVSHHNGNVIVAGHSAGGHLALWAASQCRETNMIGALALGPVADLRYAFENSLGDHAVRAFLGSSNIRADLDPVQLPDSKWNVVIVHGDQDAVAPISMSQNYARIHTKTRLVELKQCGHFAVIDPGTTVWPRILDELRMLA